MTTVLLTRLSPLSVKRAILSTGSIIRSLRIIGTERRPCVRAEQSIQRNIVHGDRDTEHGCQCDEIGPDVAVHGYAVICPPVCHNAVYIGKCILACEARTKPRGWPCRIGASVNDTVNFIR